MNDAPLGIILAAGKGTRMRSESPKCLHAVAGVPMAEHVARALREGGAARVVLVVGHGGPEIVETLGDRYQYVWQTEQRGTGHAVLMAAEAIRAGSGPVIVAAGDTPLLDGETVSRLLETHRATGAAVTVGAMTLPNPKGYGRVVLDETGALHRIVEEKDATEEERAVRTVNSGLYVFEPSTLLQLLPRIGDDNASGEIYLTDVAGLARSEGLPVAICSIPDPDVAMGVNDRWQLVLAERAWRERRLKELILRGVRIPDPAAVYIGADVTVGERVLLMPGVHLEGRTVVGDDAEIGPDCRLVDAEVGARTHVEYSVLREAVFGDDCWIGPFANVRPGVQAGHKVKIGDFVEIKNTTLGDGVKLPHLTYVGDASIGARTNVGAAVVFCNWDGFTKHRTTVGEDAFIGSNATLVAPLAIGDRALVVAGSTITSDVPDGAGAFGRARQETKEGWADRFRLRKKR